MARQLPLNANLFPGMYLFGGFALRTSRLLFGGCWGHSRILQFLKWYFVLPMDGRCKYNFSVSASLLEGSHTTQHFIMVHQHFIMVHHVSLCLIGISSCSINISSCFIHTQVSVNCKPIQPAVLLQDHLFVLVFIEAALGVQEKWEAGTKMLMSKAAASNLVMSFFTDLHYSISTKVSKVVYSIFCLRTTWIKKVVTLSQHVFHQLERTLETNMA